MHGMNVTQIASRLGISTDTLYNRCDQDLGVNFSAFVQEKKSVGDSNIHAKQYQRGVRDGNITMLLHLGKHRLGQKDTDQKDESPKEEDLQTKKSLYAALYELQQLRKEIDEIKKAGEANVDKGQE